MSRLMYRTINGFVRRHAECRVPLGCLLLWFVCSGPLYAQELPWDPLPPAEAQLSGSRIPQQGAVILFKRRFIKVYGRTTFFITKRVDYVRMQILENRGLNYADVEIPYNKGDRIVQLIARTIAPSGEIVPVSDNQIFDKIVHKVGRNTELRVRAFAFPRAEIGSILEYQIVTNRDGFWWIEPHSFDATLPTLQSSLEFSASKELFYGFATQAPPNISLEPEIHNGPQELIMRWQLRNLPPLPEEEFQPPDATMAIRVVLKPTHWRGEPLLQSWNDAASFYNELIFRSFTRQNSKVKSAVKDLTKGLNEPERVALLYNYVLENIHPVETIGIGPSATADELFESGQGDITDRNLLLVSMLQAAKLKAFPALAVTREQGILPEQFPSFSEFDRVICCVELDGKPLFLDAARQGILVRELPSETEGIRVVVVRKNKARILATGKLPMEANRVEIRTDVHWQSQDQRVGEGHPLTNDPPRMTVQIKTLLRGHEAESLRAGLNEMSAADHEEYIQEWFRSRLSELDVSSISANAPTALETLEFDATVQALPLLAANRLIVRIPTCTGLEKTPFSTARRFTPLMLSHPYEKLETGTMQVPEGYRVDELPGSVSLETNYAEFQLVIRQIGPKIEWKRRFALKQTFCPPSEYPKLRELLSEVVKWDTTPVVFYPE